MFTFEDAALVAWEVDVVVLDLILEWMDVAKGECRVTLRDSVGFDQATSASSLASLAVTRSELCKIPRAYRQISLVVDTAKAGCSNYLIEVCGRLYDFSMAAGSLSLQSMHSMSSARFSSTCRLL